MPKQEFRFFNLVYFSNMHSLSKYSLCLALVFLVPLISAGTLYGVATPGRQKLDVYTIDPQVGKATDNVTKLHLANSLGTCSKLQLSFDNRTRELAINCNDDLFYVQIWLNWQVGSISMPDTWGKGSVVNIVPTWDDTFGGNCALVLYPPALVFDDYTMGNVMCFSMGTQVNNNITYAPYKWMKKSQPYIPSTPTQNIGLFNFATKYDVILWGQSIADNSSNLIQIDSRNIMIEPWYSFMKLDVPIEWLFGSTSYSNRLMRDYIVIELQTGVIVLDRTTKSTSGLIQFCQGHTKMGSSAFDPINAIMYSIVSCFDGPKLVTFDIGNRAIKNVVNFNEDTLKIKGLFYTL